MVNDLPSMGIYITRMNGVCMGKRERDIHIVYIYSIYSVYIYIM